MAGGEAVGEHFGGKTLPAARRDPVAHAASFGWGAGLTRAQRAGHDAPPRSPVPGRSGDTTKMSTGDDHDRCSKRRCG